MPGAERTLRELHLWRCVWSERIVGRVDCEPTFAGLPMQQALFDGNFIKDEYETMCEACMDSRGKYTTSNEVEYNHVSFMKWRDWMSLALVSLIIAIFLARELELVSIKRCEALLRHGGKRGAGAGWRAMLWFVCALRQFAILLQLGASVVVLIYAHGGDIFSVCVNAVATNALPARIGRSALLPRPPGACARLG